MSPTPESKHAAFSLVEMMVSLAVLALMMIVLAQVTNSTSKLWQGTNDKISAFQNARAAFETMTQTLSQATLNTYFDYYDVSGARNTTAGSSTFAPFRYDRYSELHFLSGPTKDILKGVSRKDSTGTKSYPSVTSGHAVFFQAPLGYTKDSSARGLDNTLNAMGYFAEFGTDKDLMPSVIATKIPARYRYRLVQLMEPAESLAVYTESWSARAKGASALWFKNPLELQVAAATKPRPTQILADNVVALIVRPKRSDQEFDNANPKPTPIAPNYIYDSQPQAVIPPAQLGSFPARHQLPPLVSITLVAIDEASAVKLQLKYKEKPPLQEMGISNLFETTVDTNVPDEYERDLHDELKKTLLDEKVNYRIFETEVQIRASKWTQN